jgi:hypothetical protein
VTGSKGVLVGLAFQTLAFKTVSTSSRSRRHFLPRQTRDAGPRAASTLITTNSTLFALDRKWMRASPFRWCMLGLMWLRKDGKPCRKPCRKPDMCASVSCSATRHNGLASLIAIAFTIWTHGPHSSVQISFHVATTAPCSRPR